MILEFGEINWKLWSPSWRKPPKNIHHFLANENMFDAIVFFPFTFNQWTKIPDAVQRDPSQRYVMFMQEPPLMDGMDRSRFYNFFNWTITYRWDSDIVYHYGWIDSISSPFIMPPSDKYLPNYDYPRGNGKKILF